MLERRKIKFTNLFKRYSGSLNDQLFIIKDSEVVAELAEFLSQEILEGSRQSYREFKPARESLVPISTRRRIRFHVRPRCQFVTSVFQDILLNYQTDLDLSRPGI